MTKINKITINNLKAVSHFEGNFDGCTAMIIGGNDKGKSTILKSIPDRIRGSKPEIVLKNGEEDGKSTLELSTGERFIWEYNNEGKERLRFITKEGIKTSVTKEIANKYFPKIFDIDTFLIKSPKEQQTILETMAGLDFTELNKEYKLAYDGRTFANRDLKNEKAKAAEIDTILPTKTTPVDKLKAELATIDTHNQLFKTNQTTLETLNKTKADIEESIAKLNAQLTETEVSIVDTKLWLEKPANKLKSNKDELKAKIAMIEKENTKITANNEAIEQDKIIKEHEETVEKANAKVVEVEKKKEALLKTVKLPQGFAFGENGLTVDGFPLQKDQVSTSKLYISALKLASMNLGEVKTLYFDASPLDKHSLADIQKWAAENDFQLLIEKPDFEDGEITYELLTNIQ